MRYFARLRAALDALPPKLVDIDGDAPETTALWIPVEQLLPPDWVVLLDDGNAVRLGRVTDVAGPDCVAVDVYHVVERREEGRARSPAAA